MKEEGSNIDVVRVKNHWIDTSKEDFNTMISLFESKSYNWALFVEHISIEKLLKALYVSKFKKTCAFYSQSIQIGRAM